MVERKFHAIGHGGFITEKIDERINIVYDCGTDSDMSNLEDKIDAHFPEGTEINALFISHFHCDHINGIEYLLSNNRTIHNLVLPMMDNIDRIFYLRSQEIQPESFMGRLILDPISLSQEYRIRNVVQVSNLEENDEPRFILLEDLNPNNSNNNIITSGIPIRVGTSDWFYMPFNYQGDTQWTNWRNLLSGIVVTGNSIDVNVYLNIESAIDNVLQRTRSNGTINRDHYNRHSMVLYSGPLLNSANLSQNINNFIINNYSYPVGALYFGDYLAGQVMRWSNLSQNYNRVWNNIKVVQVTHHGSGGDYYHNHTHHNSSLYSIIDRAIIFAENGMYNGNLVHPSPIVTNYFNSISLNYNVMLSTNPDETITCQII